MVLCWHVGGSLSNVASLCLQFVYRQANTYFCILPESLANDMISRIIQMLGTVQNFNSYFICWFPGLSLLKNLKNFNIVV